jgi:hypothetical protein
VKCLTTRRGLAAESRERNFGFLKGQGIYLQLSDRKPRKENFGYRATDGSLYSLTNIR